MQKILIVFGFLLLFLFSPPIIMGNQIIKGELFYGEGCPHCAKEKIFLNKMKQKYPQFQVTEHEIYKSQENALLMQKRANEIGVDVQGVPFLIIRDKHFIGFAEGATDVAIEKAIEPSGEGKKTITLPFLGTINLSLVSLPLLTVVLGVLDGFNPCAMWTLLFLIGLLLGMKNRPRMWLLGGTFIVVSASVYFLFMVAWLQFALFFQFIPLVRIGIGLVALFGGFYSLNDFYSNKNATCKVTSGPNRHAVFEKLSDAVQKHNLVLALIGISAVAIAVNVVELVCSAGLPAVYTQALALQNIPPVQYYAYILLYILFFMIDDIIVFTIAMLTLQVTGITTKYTRLSRLIGGILMLGIGILLLFKPELLMFG